MDLELQLQSCHVSAVWQLLLTYPPVFTWSLPRALCRFILWIGTVQWNFTEGPLLPVAAGKGWPGWKLQRRHSGVWCSPGWKQLTMPAFFAGGHLCTSVIWYPAWVAWLKCAEMLISLGCSLGNQELSLFPYTVVALWHWGSGSHVMHPKLMELLFSPCQPVL